MYHFKFDNCRKPSFIKNKNLPGVAIKTSNSCLRFSNCVLCRNPPVTTIERNGTPDFDNNLQILSTCKSNSNHVRSAEWVREQTNNNKIWLASSTPCNLKKITSVTHFPELDKQKKSTMTFNSLLVCILFGNFLTKL